MARNDELPKSGSGGAAAEGAISSLFSTGGSRVLINSLSPESAEFNEEQREAIRELCAASGGYYAAGVCHTGQAAIDVATRQANSETASQEIIDRANKFLEENTAKPTEETTDESTGEDADAISDEEAISAVMASIPEQLKGIITEENVMTVLKTVIDEPMTKIKKDMGAGVEIIFPQDWKNWKVFSTIAIPGVPLPPGIIDVTIQEVIDAVGNIGGNLEDFIKDPIGTLGELGGWVTEKVEGVFGGTKDDPGWGGTLGGFEDWVKGTLGGIVGGAVLVNVYDGVKGIFDTNSATTVVPGGSDEEEPPKDEDILVDTTSAEEQFNNLLGTVTSLTDNNVILDDVDDVDDTNELGGRNQDDVITRPPGGRRIIIDPPYPDPPDDDVDDTNELGGRNQDDVIDKPGGGRTIIIDPPYSEPPDDIVIGGDIENPDPIEIGGPLPTPPPPLSSGGGGGGGGGGAADPFLRAIQYTPTVPVAIRQQSPVDYASGLMSPSTSMDAIGQLIFRNLA